MAVTTSVVYQMLRSLGCGRLKAFSLKINRWLVGAVTLSLVLHFGLLASPFAAQFKFVALSSLTVYHFALMIGLPLIGYVLGELSKRRLTT
jgi:hypothetical protein